MGAAVALALAAAASFVALGGDGDSQDRKQVVALPSKSCETSEAFEGSSSSLEPKPTKLPASAGARQLAAYGNSAGSTLIGPKDWECQSTIGADGSESIAVTPVPVESAFEEHTEEAVTLIGIPACATCMAERLCALFPDAPPVAAYSPRLPCDEKPPRESVEVIGDYAANFEDPPHVAGQGVPSGGRNAAIGTVAYEPSTGVVQVTCTLAPPQEDLCAEIATRGLADFAAGS